MQKKNIYSGYEYSKYLYIPLWLLINLTRFFLQHDKNFIAGSLNFLPHLLRETKNQKPWDTQFFKLCRGVYEEQVSHVWKEE